MRQNRPQIMIGAPVHQRAWILPVYLRHLENLDYPPEQISLGFVVNDSTDSSLAILEEWKQREGPRYGRVEIVVKNLGFPQDVRSNRHRDRIFTRLAQVRNALLSLAQKEDYLFSVDTDILVGPDTLSRFLANDKDYCSALIFNDRQQRFPNIMKLTGSGQLTHYRDFPANSLFPVAVTGAVFMAPNQVITQCRYSHHPQGEDVAFCMEARARGFEIWCDSRIRPRHVMYREDL